MTHEEIVEKLKSMIVGRLNLGISPDEIDKDQQLFASAEGGGLGLDSIEALEIVVGIEELFGVGVEYSEGVEQRFYSLNTMAEYIEELLEKGS